MDQGPDPKGVDAMIRKRSYTTKISTSAITME